MEDVLIVEDEFFLSNVISKSIEKIGLIPHLAKNLEEARKLFEQVKPSIVMVDTYLPDGKGFELVQEVKAKNVMTQIIMITGSASISLAIKAIKHGAFDYVEKQNDLDKVPIVVNNALERVRLIKQLAVSSKVVVNESHTYDLIGESEQVQQLRREVSKILLTDSHLLMIGEEGTGKKFVAKALHNYSERGSKNFVEVDARSLSHDKFCVEMLGTGVSSRTNKSILQKAHKGTLYLRNIQLLSAENQESLLKMVQNTELPIPKTDKKLSYSVRFVLSATGSVSELLEEQKLSKHLFQELAENQIHLPSLPERLDDLEHFAAFFLKKYNSSINKNIKGFAPETREALRKHKWTRNIQELAEVIEQGVLFENSAEIQLNNLNLGKKKNVTQESEAFNINKKLKEYKDLLIKNALLVTNGNKTKTAQLLGVSRRQLYRYLD